MAKKPEPAKQNALVIRGSVAWREWLSELAEHDRAPSVAHVVDKALADYARTVGFKKGAPRR